MIAATTVGLAAAIALGSAVGGDAELGVLEPAFAGTIVSTYPDGRTSRVWLNRDGSFSSDGRAHERKGGRWVIKGRNLCLSQLKPFPIPFLSYCTPIPQGGVASSWTGKADTGEPITMRVVAER